MPKKSSLTWICAALLALAVLAAATPSAADIELPLSVQWVFSMGPDPFNLSPPVVGDDLVFVSHRGTLYCLDIVTGAQQWQLRPERDTVTTGAAIWEDLVIFGTSSGLVYGVDARSGRPVWTLNCSAAIVPDPLIFDDVVIVGAAHMVYAIAPDSGEVRWISALAAAARRGPVTDGSMVYFLGQDGSIQCVDATVGRYRWRSPLVPGPRVFPPIVAQQRVIVATGNRVYGVARSGAVAWTAEMPAGVGAAPTLVGEMLFVPGQDGRLYTLYARSGAPLRDVVYQVEHALNASPAVTESAVAVGTADGLVIVFDRESGAVSWTYRCRAPDQLPNEAAQYGLYAPMLVLGGSLYCLTGSGDLYRFTSSAIDVSGPVFGDFHPEPGAAIPGGQYVAPTCSVVDDGSGVDPQSVRAFVNGQPVPMSFDIVTGVVMLRASILPDGPHIVRVTARDFRGNESSAEWSFVTDVSIGAAPERIAPGQPGFPGAAF